MSRTLFIALALHGLEDITLISIGRFLPIPTILRYGVGLLISALILWWVLKSKK